MPIYQALAISETPLPQKDRAAHIADSSILIVDDVTINCALLKSMFQKAGFQTIYLASSGADALEMIRLKKPDLVLLDIMMPDMDGFEVCKHIQAMRIENPPVIIMQTGSANSFHKVKAFELGASDYVVKPVDAPELIMRSIMQLERRYLQYMLNRERERMQKELSTAAAVQRSLLPTKEKVQSLAALHQIDIAHFVEFSSEMGGDLWGMEPVDGQALAMYTIDFSGHGLKAALNTFRIHTLTQEIASVKHKPGAALAMLNSKLKTILPTGQYATMFYGVLDMSLQRFTYSTAGSVLPLIVRSDGRVAPMEGSGLPLGCVKHSVYTEQHISIFTGDVILLYSDALFEQIPNLDEHQVLHILRDENLSAQEMLNHLVTIIKAYCDLQRLADDLTLIVVKI